MAQIQVKAAQADAVKVKTDILAVGVLEGSLSGLAAAVDKKLKGAIDAVVKLGDFNGKTGSSAVIYTDWAIAAKRVLLIGLGKADKVELDTLRKAAALAANKAVELKAETLCVCLHQDCGHFDAEKTGRVIAEGLYFGAYRFDEYLSNGASKDKVKVVKATIADTSAKFAAAASKGVKAGAILGAAQNFTRGLANRPASVVTPKFIADEAKKLARQVGLKCTVLDEKQLASKKMGGILAVGQGSANKPRLILLEYKPAKAAKNAAAVALVGKAITFDSGGISIKPSEGMQDMKFDKSGGMAVLGAMRAIAQLKPKMRVVGLIPSAENMPSGTAYRPGDIVRMYNGKTVEIHSTDAEGRMILGDAIAYAEELGCRTIVDIATLTGACVVALGQKRAGVMGNDDGLVERLKAASKAAGERIWHLPCDDEYVDLMKSKIADLKNTGGRWAGACTGAAFLSQFIKDAKWAHLDIAGVGVWGADEGTAPGSIGFGVRLLTEFVIVNSR